MCSLQVVKMVSKNKPETKSSRVLLWFLRNNSIGGLSSSYTADNRKSRLFWVILFLSGCGLTLYGVHQTLTDYLQFNCLTKISYEYPKTLRMPAVTVCNSNRIHCLNLYNLIRGIPQVKVMA